MSRSISVTQKKILYETINLSDEESLDITKQYLKKVIIGNGCYINKNGDLEHWTSFPHGSGTTTNMGTPTQLQKTAYDLLQLL